MARTILQERNPWWVSAGFMIAVAPFWFLPLCLAYICLCGVLGDVLDWGMSATGHPNILISIGLIGCLFTLVLFLYVCLWLCWRTYSYARWVRISYDGSWCLTCGYNLTGNVSGLCPECGEKIVMDEPSRDVAH